MVNRIAGFGCGCGTGYLMGGYCDRLIGDLRVCTISHYYRRDGF